MQTKAPQTVTPLLEKMNYLTPKEWITRVLLDPSITSSYAEPEFQDSTGKLLQSETNAQHLSVASSDNEFDALLEKPDSQSQSSSVDAEMRPLLPRIKAYLTYLAKKVFVETYEFDGLHLANATYTRADGVEINYPGDELPLSMIIWTFLGFPTRPQFWEQRRRNKQSLRLIGFGLIHNISTILRNMFGGSPHPEIETIKAFGTGRALLLAGLVIEAFIIKPSIFLIKFAELFFKIPLNIIKFGTEYIPSFLKNITGTLVGQLAKNWNLTTELYNNGQIGFGSALGGYLVFGFAMVLLAPIHYAIRIATIVLTAATSPLKNAKAAWNLGASLMIDNDIGDYNYISVILVGSLFLAASIALSAALWAIAFPLIFTGLTTLIPALNTAISALMGTPLIASTFTSINAAITSAWAYLGLTSAFAYVSNALALSMGIHIAASNLAFGVAAGLVAAPTAIFAAQIAAAFSNGWARLNQMSFKKAFFPLFFKHEKDDDTRHYHHNHGHGEGVSSQYPRQHAQHITRKLSDSDEELNQANQFADEYELKSTKRALPTMPTIEHDETRHILTLNKKPLTLRQIKSAMFRIDKGYDYGSGQILRFHLNNDTQSYDIYLGSNGDQIHGIKTIEGDSHMFSASRFFTDLEKNAETELDRKQQTEIIYH